MQSRSSLPTPRKLKDACDLCAASKVRCDRQKPVCARCAGLNHQCLYSPARRVGRPHRVRPKNFEHHQQSATTTKSFVLDDARLGHHNHNHHQHHHHPTTHDADAHLVLGPAPREQQPALPLLGLGHVAPPHPPPEHAADAFLPQRSSPGGRSGEPECCATAAAAVIEQLDVAARSPFGAHDSAAVAELCGRLSAVLVCPCSQQPSVALLAASACMALLDTVDAAAAAAAAAAAGPSHRAQAQAQAQGIATPATSATATPDFDGHVFRWSVSSSTSNGLESTSPSSSSSLSAGGHGEGGGGAAAGLAQVAKLVHQFASRYGQPNVFPAEFAHTPWIVEPLVASLWARLHAVAGGVAGRWVTWQ